MQVKNVLLISYHFPPSTAVGGIRIANFARYLPGFGWNPVVLTIKDKHIDNIDTGRLADFDNTRIVKVGKTIKLSRFYLPMKKILGAERKGGTDPAKEQFPSIAGSAISSSDPLYRRVRHYIRAFMALPDSERNWILPAAYAAIREVRERKIDCILTSCPPYSSHLAGLIVKAVTGVRWIADYRDPWSITGKKTVVATCGMSLAIERWLEGKVIRHADSILANTERMADAYRKRYASGGAGKFVYLPNMIDPNKYDGYRRMEKYPKFTISYTGSFYVGRSPEPLFTALRELMAEGKIREDEILVKLVGHCDRIEGIPVSAVIRRYGLESSVEVSGLVPHATALEITRRSHLGLLLAPEQPLQIPAKVYEYMGLGTRILAIANEGATKDLMEKTGCGRAFGPSDINGIKAYIEDSMGGREQEAGNGNGEILEAFGTPSVVRTLSVELSRLCAGSV